METTLTHDKQVDIVYDVAFQNEMRCDAEVRPDYSGRGMYGSICYGIVTNEPDCIKRDAMDRGLPEPSMDSMGRSTIVYWPSIEGERQEEPE